MYSNIVMKAVICADIIASSLLSEQQLLSTQTELKTYIQRAELWLKGYGCSFWGRVVRGDTLECCLDNPHFAELGHHQPAIISETIRQKIDKSIPKLLSALDYSNGPSHIECKYKEDELYLIEANLRGGGDAISNQLVQLSTGVDYLKGIIDIALGTFQENDILPRTNSYAGIYYLCTQTAKWLPFFEAANKQPWFVEGQIYSTDLHESHSNYERDGYLIYKSSRKIIPLCNE